ncbi:MAG: helix-turn-helix domain-containing protein [Candidatus Cybelea sp.]
MEDEGRVASSSEFGTLLRRYRLAAGLSQEALAERARMSTNGIGALERGYRRTPQRDTLTLLCAALALSGEQRGEFEAAATHSGSRRRIGVGALPDGAGLDTFVSNLPIALTSFVGRETELSEIARLVHDHRLVTLTGAGGIGKTQTALQVGAALTETGGTAVCFVALAPVGDPALVVAAIASTLSVQEVPGRPLLETLLAYLKNKTLLLILDNCEHVITQAAIVAGALLAGCPRCAILATSREPLRTAGEHTYRLPSLSVPAPERAQRLSAAEALSYGAIVLFSDRARAVDHRFMLNDENASAIAGICRHLDGIPLAIELAAARVNMLPVHVIAKRFDHRFVILTGGDRTALPRQQTMRAAIDWSYDLLAAREQRTFEQLSVFAGGCTVAAANAVCAGDDVAEGDVLDLLQSLVDKSILVADLDGLEPRYWLLESFREYAREKLAARGEVDGVARRHALACLQLAEQLERACDTEPDVVWRALAQEELDNWRAALQWALTDRSDVVLGQELVGALHVVWAYFAPLEGQRYAAAAFELAGEQTPTHVLARLGYAEGIVAMQHRAYKVQLSCSERAIERFRAVGDPLGIARTQDLAGQALVSLGRITEAKTLLQQALTGARMLGNRRLVACVLRNLGYASAVDGDCSAARDYVAEALPIYQALGASLGVALALDDLGEFEFRAGNAELAFRLATDALATFRAVNNERFVAFVLSSLSMYLIALGRYEDAEERACEALVLARQQQQDVLVAWTLLHLGAIAALRPHISTVREPATAYGQAARILGFVDVRLEAIGSAKLYLHEQEYNRVLAILRDAIGAGLVASLMADGGVMTEEQAVEEASETRCLERPA